MKIASSKLKPRLLVKTAARKARLKDGAVAQALSVHAVNQLTAKLQIHYRQISELKPSAKQVRRVTEAQLKPLRRSVAEFGVIEPITVRGDVVINGHARLKAAEQLGLSEVPAIDISHLSEKECELLKVGLNRMGELGEWDLDALRDVMLDLKIADLDLELTGFTLPELDLVLLDPLEEVGPNELNELPKPRDGAPVSRTGDLWLLDAHKLLCGSSLEQASFATLMAGHSATMMLTDPPYNVKIAGNVSGLGKVKHGEFKQASGEMSEGEFEAFLSTFTCWAASMLAPGAMAYVFMDWRHINALILAGGSAGLKLLNLIVWNKDKGGMGSLYRSAHELVFAFCKGESPATNNVQLGRNGRDRTNVWTYPGATKPGSSAAKLLKDHPTPKPVELLHDAMLDVTSPGDLVLDPFMGSGTTIIAAEECGRAARGIELDPKYVDLAVRRWEAATGKSATLAETGETFAAVAERRAAEPGGA